ncbi:MAG TPA: folylpolyglutamate synthase/dihydrofolate synthase family protein [Terriglobales bacterium]|nr:folylpolyglutamate synthase/dihydrofolate synthase family protein [Terriglobales bacterium]
MSYETAVANLYALGHELATMPSHKFDLEHMRVLLGAMGHPEKKFPAVLIAGTNGKGSTAATLAAILHAAGYRTALYTSPHLIRLNERIRVGGREINDAEFAKVHDRVEEIANGLVRAGELPWHPSFFEMLTAIAFGYFALSKVDIAVLEVGMGGRLDATNVVEPRLSVITDISLDHQKFLGNTVGEIAREKAGIIRAGGAVVTLPQHPEANDVIGNTILERQARAVSAVPYVPPVSPGSEVYIRGNGTSERSGRSSYPLTVLGERIQVQSPLIGRHQLRNVALAIAAAVELNQHGFKVTAAQVERGIRDTHWPARFHILPATKDMPELVLDVAHNPAGAWALRSALSERYDDRPKTMIFGAMRDKAVHEMEEILFPVTEHVIATQAENPRSATPEEIREAAQRTGADVETAENVPAAIARARSLAKPNGVVVITGSIYLVGEAMRALGISA